MLGSLDRIGKNKKQACDGLLFIRAKEVLKDADLIGLRTFLPLNLDKGNLLAFLEGLEAGAYDRAEMDEQITALFTLDKPVSLCFIEPFNGSFLLL